MHELRLDQRMQLRTWSADTLVRGFAGEFWVGHGFSHAEMATYLDGFNRRGNAPRTSLNECGCT